MKTLTLVLMTALGLLGACAHEPGGKIEATVELQATVTAVDQEKRLVTLKPKEGEPLVVQVGDAVKNFDQVRVGDVVKVSYTEALAWQVKKPSEDTPGVSIQSEATRAAPGQKPGGGVTDSVTVTTTITAIDTAKSTVTLTGPEGNSRTIKVLPETVKKVKVGDLVTIIYSEALAASIVPVSTK
jgi:hypothetical protein